MDLAKALLSGGRKEDAVAETQAACGVTTRLIATDPSVQRWRATLRDCLIMRTQLALTDGAPQDAMRYAANAVATGKSVSSTDRVEDRYAVAGALRLLGDIRLRLGDVAGARAAWEEGLALVSASVAEKPNEMAEHVMLLRRLGRGSEAQERAARLAADGYRNSDYRSS
jgi:hypothetical protein